MEQLWERYLNSILPIEEIDRIVIYTDHFRYWLADGLLDFAQILDWKISLQLIEEITDEEGMEIRQGLGYLSENTLLITMFSDRNPIIDELNSIFPLLHAPHGFQGYSVILHQSLPDQYFPLHLQTDILNATRKEESYQELLQNDVTLIGQDETYLEANLIGKGTFPFGRGKSHTILPATEIIRKIEPSSLDGTIRVKYSIGAYIEQNELVDPFGLISGQLDLLVEEGSIVDIRGNDVIKRRLQKVIQLPYTTDEMQLSMGLGLEQPVTGFIEHDRLLSDVLTISWIDKHNESYLEFVVGPVNLEG